MVDEKTIDGELGNYDNDSYDDYVEAPVIESKQDLLKEIDLSSVTPRELLLYFANRYKETHGFDYVVDWVKEVAIFKSFIDRYNQEAGYMVALLFDKHQGKINDMILTATAFSKGSKWIQDTLYIELQKKRQKEETKTSTEGLLNTNEFLKRFTV